MVEKKYIAGGTAVVVIALASLFIATSPNTAYDSCFGNCTANYEQCKLEPTCTLNIPESELNNTCESVCLEAKG